MAVTIYNIKKWTRMICKKSIYHVNQPKGKAYSKEELKGYYNDLTEKVTKSKYSQSNELPEFITASGNKIRFSIGIFQYGLGAYDLFLMSEKKIYFDKFLLCADWAVSTQDKKGAWDTFSHESKDAPYSSMAQGEGISLLLRAFKETRNEVYREAAKRAMEFMLDKENGLIIADGKQVYFREFMDKPVVLNGWVFTLFGLLDYCKVFEDESVYQLYQQSLDTMAEHLCDYDLGYWSRYDQQSLIASPFYHSLHIALLEVLYDLTKRREFQEYAFKWNGYTKQPFNKIRAFILKAYQKIRE